MLKLSEYIEILSELSEAFIFYQKIYGYIYFIQMYIFFSSDEIWLYYTMVNRAKISINFDFFKLKNQDRF